MIQYCTCAHKMKFTQNITKRISKLTTHDSTVAPRWHNIARKLNENVDKNPGRLLAQPRTHAGINFGPTIAVVHTMYKLTQNLHQTYHQKNKNDTIVDPKSHDISHKVISNVKNPWAPIGTTPDECWHKLWGNNSRCAECVNSTKLTPNVSPN